MAADVPVAEVVNLDALVDALDTPTSSEVYSVVEPFSPTAAASSAIRRALEGGGGGGTPTYASRAAYAGSSVTVPDGFFNTELTWNSLGSGAALLDISSNPAQPTVIAGGIYAVMASVICDEFLTAGGAFLVVLHLDRSNEDAIGEATGGAGTQKAGGSAQALVSVACTYYIPPGGVISVTVALDDGAEARDFHLREAIIQLLPGGPA